MLKNEREIKCVSCGNSFLLRDEEYERLVRQKKRISSYCKFCRKIHYEEMRAKRKQEEAAARQIQQRRDHERFEENLKTRKVVNRESILNQTNQVLYILGNGFDLMHGVKSSYYDFQKVLGKNSHLRFCLETYLDVDDLWCDFEAALGHMNVSAMSSASVMDMWLDMFDAYDEDASAASFTLAYEYASEPARVISNELKERFRNWIESLKLQTKDQPLRNLISNQKVLCFNYTEFVEKIYDVEPDHICYIHGCRHHGNGKSEELILGHMPDTWTEWDCDDDKYMKRLPPYKQYLIDSAQDLALTQISHYDEDITKHCDRIIQKHEAFFFGLRDITDVIVIGHSLSEVDWDYYSEVISKNENIDDMNWYFGCYSLRDLQSIDKFVKELKINPKKVYIFRTDDISVHVEVTDRKSTAKAIKEKVLCESDDKRWTVKEKDGELSIHDRTNAANLFLLIFTTRICVAYFILDDTYLLLIAKGAEKGVFLLHRQGEIWEYVSELQGIPHQGIMNPRLRRVLYTEEHLIFVYNGRVRTYRLSDGVLDQNIQRQHAASYCYEGIELKV